MRAPTARRWKAAATAGLILIAACGNDDEGYEGPLSPDHELVGARIADAKPCDGSGPTGPSTPGCIAGIPIEIGWEDGPLVPGEDVPGGGVVCQIGALVAVEDGTIVAAGGC